jgi:hypothetical protein
MNDTARTGEVRRGFPWTGRGRPIRTVAVAALTGAAVASPICVGSVHAAEPNCPTGSLCLFPQADYQGKPRILTLPHSAAARAFRLDDAGCTRFQFASLIDNSGYGGWAYDNRDCANDRKVKDFEHGSRIAKFDWSVKSFIFPVDNAIADP